MQENELKNGQNVPPQDEAAQQAPAEAPELPDLDLSAELAKAQAKAAENYDLYVRAVAEADNTRRRASEDVAKPVNSALKICRVYAAGRRQHGKMR